MSNQNCWGGGTVGPNQTKTIQIRSWMDINTTETQGEGKEFTFKITIESTAEAEAPLDPNSLGAKILAANEIRKEEPDFSRGYPNSSSDTALSGLYKTEDDDGDSYYFRGKIENNYVQMGTYKEDTYLYIVGEGQDNETVFGRYTAAENYCNELYNEDYNYSTADACISDIKEKTAQTFGQPILWRIVRINGDGTIRLVTDNPIGETAFNIASSGYQGVGYTYDNTTPCTKDKPCKSEYNGSSFINSNGGTDSTVKTYLENWYKTTLNEFDTKIAYGTYCNDTSYGSGTEDTTPSSSNLYYGPYKRLNTDKKPDLYCSNPTKQGGSENRLYGGIYQLKIGLLTADEMNFAGLAYYSNSPYATRDNYLLKYLSNSAVYWWWSISPGYSNMSDNNEFEGLSDGKVDAAPTYGTDYSGNVARPVINIAKNVTVTGQGTIGDPYVIQ